MGAVLAEELKKSMEWLAAQPGVLFLGQSVGVPGTKMSDSLADIDPAKRLEMPVAEELQLGMSLGLSLQGYVPVSVFPRWNFLLCAANQLVNHLDKLEEFSGYRPKVIIRVASGRFSPLNAGPQHTGDLSEAFWHLLRNIPVVAVTAENAFAEYRAAFGRRGSSILVE